MNKKEQAYVEDLETRLALRFTGEGPIAHNAAVFARGAEAMRAACQKAMREADESFRTYEESWDEAERLIRALPIPEMKREESWKTRQL